MPASDPDAVVDSEGRMHGIDGLYVADASLMPAVTRGNTNMPTAVIGERIAWSLLGRQTVTSRAVDWPGPVRGRTAVLDERT